MVYHIKQEATKARKDEEKARAATSQESNEDILQYGNEIVEYDDPYETPPFIVQPIVDRIPPFVGMTVGNTNPSPGFTIPIAPPLSTPPYHRASMARSFSEPMYASYNEPDPYSNTMPRSPIYPSRSVKPCITIKYTRHFPFVKQEGTLDFGFCADYFSIRTLKCSIQLHVFYSHRTCH